MIYIMFNPDAFVLIAYGIRSALENMKRMKAHLDSGKFSARRTFPATPNKAPPHSSALLIL
jgi:hypothetical protein